MKKEPISVRDSDSIEEVAETIEKYDLVALPVVDSIGRLVGRITIDDVMDEVREQHERDYQLASGISQDVETSDNVFTQTAARLPLVVDRHDRRTGEFGHSRRFRRESGK